jgi:acetate kinase
MKILVINAGSSSLKYQLIDMTNESVILKGLCERITFTGGQLTQKTYYLNCNTNMSTLRSNNITLKIQFNKIFGGYGYWHEADLSVTYIPK